MDLSIPNRRRPFAVQIISSFTCRDIVTYAITTEISLRYATTRPAVHSRRSPHRKLSLSISLTLFLSLSLCMRVYARVHASVRMLVVLVRGRRLYDVALSVGYVARALFMRNHRITRPENSPFGPCRRMRPTGPDNASARTAAGQSVPLSSVRNVVSRRPATRLASPSMDDGRYGGWMTHRTTCCCCCCCNCRR